MSSFSNPQQHIFALIKDKKRSFQKEVDSLIHWENWNREQKENEIYSSNKVISSIKEKVRAEKNKLIRTLSNFLQEEKKQGIQCGGNYNISVNQAKKVVDSWKNNLSVLSKYRKGDGWNDEDIQELLSPQNKEGVAYIFSKINDDIVESDYFEFWKRLKRNVFTLTKNKIEKILNDESAEFQNENEVENLIYGDSPNSNNYKCFFYYPNIKADTVYLRQAIYDKTNKTI